MNIHTSIIKLKTQIFNESIAQFKNNNWDKKIIIVIIYCGGITRTSKLFSDCTKTKNSLLKNIYFEKFGEKISKNHMMETILENLHIYENKLKKLLIHFFILKFKGNLEKIIKKTNIAKEEIIHKIKEFGFSLPKTSSMKNKLYKRSKKGFVTPQDIREISKELNCTEQNVRINIKKMNIIYKNNKKIKQEYEEKKFKEMINYFKNNEFIFFEEKYWINKKGDIFKINKENKIKKITPILRKNQHGYNYSIISIKSKQYHLHKLIADLFIYNPNNYKYVRAIDKNPNNISINNLEWIKYPAVSRVINKISKKDSSWLNFIIKNINVNWTFTEACQNLADFADKNAFFIKNQNKKSTIETIIKNYSQSNSVFPIFNINKKMNNKISIDFNLLNRIIKRKTLLINK